MDTWTADANPEHAGPPEDEGGAWSRAEDERLIRRAIGGEAEATQALWVACRRWVAAICLAHMPREADLEDLLQDVAVAFVRHVHTVRDPGAFRGWLRQIAANTARAAGRERTRRKRLDPEAHRHRAQLRLTPAGDEENAGERVSSLLEGEGDRLLRLAMELPEGYREPLLLRCVRGMSYKQIGAVTGLPESTIETRIARGRRMLRELAARPRATDAMTDARTEPETATETEHAETPRRGAEGATR
ncbi:MAG: sigma-70 family RNA polymerase sigma factor [Phycisphaerales bacterium]|nr:MAG: sigma-70 family RNA polymerase sigma factor [Phycisphaerales bacterium]